MGSVVHHRMNDVKLKRGWIDLRGRMIATQSAPMLGIWSRYLRRLCSPR